MYFRNFIGIVFLIFLFFLPFQADSESELLNKEFYQDEAYEAIGELPPEIIKNLPPDINAQVTYFLNYYRNEKKEVIQNWLARCSLFLPYFRAIFKKYDLPEDLVYLAYIESGCNPLATSPAGAAGIWQFMEITARNYGLKIDDWIDERRDFIKSTYAAAQYLKTLYKTFGDWRIAIASYNLGAGKLKRILEARNFADYWQIVNSESIPVETSFYLPQWMAITLIAKEPEKYGFSSTENRILDYEEMKVNGGIDLRVFSVAGKIDYDILLLLNAELRKRITPPDTIYTLKVPFGKKEVLQVNLLSIKTVKKEKNFSKKRIEIITLPD